uniref:Uncharacterized protein n=1 Tax=Arundo donax TaxID=35708 RepID=A0A0A8Z351_ARUDO
MESRFIYYHSSVAGLNLCLEKISIHGRL